MRLLLTLGCIYIAVHCFRAAYILGDWVLGFSGVIFTVLSFVIFVPIYIKVEGGETNGKRSS